MAVSTFRSGETTNSEVFRKYTELCATSAAANFSRTVSTINGRNLQPMYNDATNSTFTHNEDPNHTSPSISNHQKRTPGNPQVIPTTCEASNSKRARRPPTTGSGMSVGRSNQLSPIRTPTNTKGCSSAAGSSYAYADLEDCNQRCCHCGASFWTSRDKCKEIDIPEFKIRLYSIGGAQGYELPTSNTLRAMVFESGITSNTDFESGYHTNLKLKSADGSGKEKIVTMLAYYRYQFHFRLHQYNLIFRGGKLFQQYVVGLFCIVEQNQMDFIRKKQNDIQSDYLSGLYDAISRGERDG
ncbi:DNA helicase [Tanacetum coccineum]